MDPNILRIAFIAFIFLLVIVVTIVRKLSVDEVRDGFFKQPSSTQNDSFPFPDPMQKTFKTASPTQKSSQSTPPDLRKIGNVLNIVGIVLLFAPFADVVKFIGVALLIISSIIKKTTVQPEKKRTTAENPTQQKARELANQPAYKSAMRILLDDYQYYQGRTPDEIYKRAVEYLGSKGVPPAEAKKNLMLLYTVMNLQNKTQAQK